MREIDSVCVCVACHTQGKGAPSTTCALPRRVEHIYYIHIIYILYVYIVHVIYTHTRAQTTRTHEHTHAHDREDELTPEHNRLD